MTSLETVRCSRCPNRFKVTVRNGLKAYRLCPTCRSGGYGAARRPLGRNTAVSGGVRGQKRESGLRRQKRPAGAKSSIRPKKLWLKVDRAATESADFLDVDSKVILDGRWVLSGADKEIARRDIFERDGYKCVFCKNPVTWETGQWHHLRHKERVKDDRPQSGVTACDICHKAQHPNQRTSWSVR